MKLIKPTSVKSINPPLRISNILLFLPLYLFSTVILSAQDPEIEALNQRIIQLEKMLQELKITVNQLAQKKSKSELTVEETKVIAATKVK